jgi:hypothetical protein
MVEYYLEKLNLNKYLEKTEKYIDFAIIVL